MSVLTAPAKNMDHFVARGAELMRSIVTVLMIEKTISLIFLLA
jgi:hypothetical protein